jgi:AraC-like DNA-binding protein
MPITGATARREISTEIRRFLSRSHITRLRVAQGSVAPPSLAYMVSFARLSVTLSGEDRVEMEQAGLWQIVRARRGDALFVPANVANRPTWTGNARTLTILLGARHAGVSLVPITRVRRSAPVALKAQIDTSSEGPFHHLVAALTNLIATDPSNAACRSTVEAILHCVASLLEHAPSEAGSKASRTYQSLCLYMQEHFHLPITRDSLAEQFRLSPNHVSRVFRQQGLMTFGDYLNWVRIDRAKLMLRRHDFNLEEVAVRCGFNQLSYFCRVFKSRTRMTPTQYRLGTSAPPSVTEGRG